MRALIIETKGSPVTPNIRYVEDYPTPSPRAGELLVRTEASSLNHLDLWVGRGLPGAEDFPRISGSDGCGRVEATGDGVHPDWVGRRVIINAAVPAPQAAHPDHAPALPMLHMIGEASDGCHAEYFTVPASNALDVGDHDPVNAAAYGLTHLTAWRMMVTRSGLQPGQWVLITGIGGGLALAALHLANHLGCRTIVTSRHQWKLDRARELGAHHGILDSGEDWSREARSITGKRGVDVCVESVGQAVHSSVLKSLARGGIMTTCGATTGPAATTDLMRIFWNQLSIMGSTMGDMEEFRQSTALFQSGAISPVIDQVIDASSGQEAWARLESGDQFGKIVLNWT
ncbi:MAG: zinc-binding dehydrogenase [Phycisphaerales bacterium]|nr:zinc-binding dehydrogenase [Phycisphaerales bacterium]